MHAQEVKECLIEAGVTNLYHCNTVVTSLSFINSGGLLSRQTTGRLMLPQTDQETDESDKILGIYNDIFFDSVDIHQRAHTINNYGAVLFVYPVDVLDSLLNYDICITKDNPIRWNEHIMENDRYFQSKEELLSLFEKGNFYQHITIRDIGVAVPFDYLEEIVIDNPGEERKEYLCNAINCIESALRKNNYNYRYILESVR